jgi:hypothetical protein
MFALWAALLVAPWFGGIHLPLLFVSEGLTNGRVPVHDIPLFILYLLILFSVPVRVVAAWLYNSAKGSLLLIGLFHASLGATAGNFSALVEPCSDELNCLLTVVVP